MDTVTESSTAFREAMARLRGGDEQAAWDLIQEYEPHLRRVIRRKLDVRMQSKFDSIDFVQMVWTSFFRDPVQAVSFENPDHLCRYLVRIAKHKFIDEYRRRMGTQKYAVHRERSIDESPSQAAAVPTDNTTPSQFAIARERWNRLMESQSQRNRDIVRLRIEGSTYDEISRELGIDERTVRRVVERLLAASEREDGGVGQ